MKIRTKPPKKARIEIIPMIDVIFFLLVFFMVSSLAMTRMNSVPVALPKTSSSPQAMGRKVTLTIKRDGSLYVNQTPVDLQGLGTVLAAAFKDMPQEALIVSADEGANYGRVIAAMDQARLVGLRKFALATEAAKGQ